MNDNRSTNVDLTTEPAIAQNGGYVQPFSEVFNEDCIQVMKRYPDKFFDLAVVDPPYGNESSYNNRRNLKPYENIEPKKEYYHELFRVSKNQIVWGANYLRNFDLKGGGIVWNKLGTKTDHRKQAPTIGDCEYAFQSFTNNIKMFSYGWMGNVMGNNYQINPPESKERFHPSQKPVALYEWIFHNYAINSMDWGKHNIDFKVLDTHLGSGSSRIAAHKAGLSFVGCEIDKEYFDLQEVRFKEFVSQLRLF